MSKITYGTSHFLSLSAAIAYYSEYHEPAAEVRAKVKAGEIHIGPPALQPDETLSVIDEGRRYAITYPGNAS